MRSFYTLEANASIHSHVSLTRTEHPFVARETDHCLIRHSFVNATMCMLLTMLRSELRERIKTVSEGMMQVRC